ncbi:MAG: bifunctional adenosylcobinamide kinase/adenosylcobinamide-phosphate guanylyltransferase [Candidatus Omnitrophica bacterium]|nr:bifunctional adenosylcobinamide kinase/adenosylcobinamide-phosphate guanylyltransferase [Candidatus Omnitrophota bacterium]MDD5236748.1 bifunctional adenosylcobinamide kinase/adenosylcobinamide-phosphate guanylyltransferase [Candidatus Omnitrophota bacterium]MDD5610263.1 bifunctional adenosylcobinamide kinase/adenosylcobinamide-phosphate guanylyltransferase [Candidatus Omnitrophota bacterium]
MGKITLVLGGARSGKSTYALGLAKKYKRVAFIATAQALDKEMRQRIKKHRVLRPPHWVTFERDEDIIPALENIGNDFDCVIIDCLTLWVSNLLLTKNKEEKIMREALKMLAQLEKMKIRSILVSNEVGLGLVPVHELGRKFRDVAGRVNQLAAREADEVFFTVSGIPVKVK